MDINAYSEYAQKAMKILPNGAFLTTQNVKNINTMTIGWGTFGCQWGIPTVEVMVRQSRFTKTLLDETNEFTITFPNDPSIKPALGFCGQKSGKDVDKISECKLNTLPSKEISTPVVACKGVVFECKVIAKTEMTNTLTNEKILEKWYKNGDLHTIYYAEVVSCYEIN